MPRSSEFTQKIADLICEKLVTGLSLRKICLDDEMPALATIFRWLNDNASFREQYARAREAQAETLVDEIIDIADESSRDTYIDDDGNERTNHDVIARSRLRFDARRWAASKMLPKKYGDKIEANHTVDAKLTGNVGLTLTLSPEESYKRMLDGE